MISSPAIKLHLSVFLITLFTGIDVRVFAQQPASKSGPTLRYEVKPWYKYRSDRLAGRELVFYPEKAFKGKVKVIVECEGKKETNYFTEAQSLDSLSVLLPAGIGVKQAAEAGITVLVDNREFRQTVHVPIKKQWTVYIYPHSHVDVGYTNLQEVVKKLHVRNIDVGIDIARKTQHYPEGARFIWNPEATWLWIVI